MSRIPIMHIVLLLSCFTLFLCSCTHRELVTIGNTHYVRVYIDENIKNVTEGFYDVNLPHPPFVRPNVMRLMLCDKNTGKVVSERYLQNSGSDENGYFLDGYIVAPPGSYDLMTYNFGTETTLLRNEYDMFTMEAYTNSISPMLYSKLPSVRTTVDPSSIVYPPDHLFVFSDYDVDIAPSAHIDTLKPVGREHFRAETMVQTYYLQLRISGIQWVRSSVGLLAGISNSKNLNTKEIDFNYPAILYFDMADAYRQKTISDTVENQTAILYAVFNTFGRIEKSESILEITLEFVKTDGKSQVETMKITPLFDTPEGRDHQWLLIDKEIVITPPEPGPEEGGFTPGVDEWIDEETDIII